MLLARLPLLLVALLAGCCCPELSGRYGCCPTACRSLAGGSCQDCGCRPRAEGPSAGGLLAGEGIACCSKRGGVLAGFFQRRVPSQQHADYVSPLAKFHPVPTRPVFEPLASYSPPQLEPIAH